MVLEDVDPKLFGAYLQLLHTEAFYFDALYISRGKVLHVGDEFSTVVLLCAQLWSLADRFADSAIRGRMVQAMRCIDHTEEGIMQGRLREVQEFAYQQEFDVNGGIMRQMTLRQTVRALMYIPHSTQT